tara:strand:+ start:638 stop:859 length:222 start_codon:yes stop_codon:yes gene_type:complete
MNFLGTLETPATLPPNRIKLAHNPSKRQLRLQWHRRSHNGKCALLRRNIVFDLEIEKLVELSGIEPLTSTMPL